MCFLVGFFFFCYLLWWVFLIVFYLFYLSVKLSLEHTTSVNVIARCGSELLKPKKIPVTCKMHVFLTIDCSQNCHYDLTNA